MVPRGDPSCHGDHGTPALSEPCILIRRSVMGQELGRILLKGTSDDAAANALHMPNEEAQIVDACKPVSEQLATTKEMMEVPEW